MMKLPLLVLAVCAVGRANIQPSYLMNFGWYWRHWDVNTPIPEDAVAGGVDARGYPTYVARSVYNKFGVIVPGKASPQAKKMWFESDHREHTKTKDIEILCVLNENRIKWVAANDDHKVDSVGGVLIFGGAFGIGRKKIGNEIEIGKIVISKGKFWCLRLCQNQKCWAEYKEYEVLVYVDDESVDT